MTDHANPWLLGGLIAGCVIMFLAIVVPLWRHRKRSTEREPVELDNDQPLVRVPPKAKEPPVFINTIGKD